MRDGDEKRFGSSTGNRIALCGVAVLVKSTNKKTNKKKSDPYRQHCPALQPKAAQGLPKAPSIPTGNLQADLQGRAQADLQGRAQAALRLPRLPNPGTGAGAGTSI